MLDVPSQGNRWFDPDAPYEHAPGSLPDLAGTCPDCGSLGAGGALPAGHVAGQWRDTLARLIEPDARYRGPGRPLLRESWRYRPFSAGWFIGVVEGDELIDDWLGQKRGPLGGYRLGWDFDHYWGCEMRLGWGYLEVYDSQRAKDAQKAADDASGLAPDDSFRKRFDAVRHSALAPVWDVSLLYYPWGDAAWRPYLLAGLGHVRIDVWDRLTEHHAVGTWGIPLGVGVKYRWKDWLALRFELTDNIAWGRRAINTVHELSATGGVEVRFGGTRKAYWPWNPGLHYW